MCEPCFPVVLVGSNVCEPCFPVVLVGSSVCVSPASLWFWWVPVRVVLVLEQGYPPAAAGPGRSWGGSERCSPGGSGPQRRSTTRRRPQPDTRLTNTQQGRTSAVTSSTHTTKCSDPAISIFISILQNVICNLYLRWPRPPPARSACDWPGVPWTR